MGSYLVFVFFFFFFLSFAFLLQITSSGTLITGSVTPNFTASFLQFVDQSGAFLRSANGTFKVSFSKPKPELSQYYLSILHSFSNSIVWTANRNIPISDSAKLTLTVNGLTITNDDDGGLVWSTPKLNSPISAMQLLDSGNLVLLDGKNETLWESFDSPTDTILIGQRLRVGRLLDGAASENDLSVGDYRFVVTDGDALLQWNEMTYWKLSMYKQAFKDSNSPVSFLSMNRTGLYLFASDESTIVIQVVLDAADIRIAKMEANGKFTISKFVGNTWVQELAIPVEDCRIPFFCRRIGLCSEGSCSCPSSFHSQTNGNCVPINSSLSLPSACTNASALNSSITYLNVGNGIDYFANDFVQPVEYGIGLLDCQELCSGNCSCLGIFYDDSSDSCYFIENRLGSIMSSSDGEPNRSGYIKATVLSSDGNTKAEDQNSSFSIAGLALIPTFGFFLLIFIIVVGFVWWRRKNRRSRSKVIKLGSRNSSSDEFELVSIAGLPRRFSYDELVSATDNFKTQIGSGGFGTVYKGILQDKSFVAVKKINNFGGQGKKEFCTEIAIIGNIHHVNLVKLKGFCAQGRQRFLVYEYMNKGSLDKALFRNGPVLAWRERFEIALGTARGLAYLHSGCEHKIIHCDVKPENILLHDNLQTKISDFGLSKLLTPEQSTLFTTMRGTRGYLAPEWLTSSAISDKTDVYSYGMVLLEIISGRRNCSFQALSPSTERDSSEGNDPSSSSSPRETRPMYFPLLALEMHEQRRYSELGDSRLKGQVTSEEIEKLVRIALCCVQEEPMLRPSMGNVVSMLEGGTPVGTPRIGSLRFLRFYGQRFNEASTIEESNERNEFILQSDASPTLTTVTNVSQNYMSYISSQEVSGPR